MDISLFPEMKAAKEIEIKIPLKLGLISGPCLIYFDKNTVLLRHIVPSSDKRKISNILGLERESFSLKVNNHLKNHYKIQCEDKSVLMSIIEKEEIKVTHVK